MFNLSTALDVGFANPISRASVGITFQTSSGIGTGEFDTGVSAFFTIQEAGNIAPVILTLSGSATSTPTTTITVNSAGRLIITGFAFQSLGVNTVINLVNAINNIPTEGIGTLTDGSGSTTGSRILRNCVASIDPTDDNTLILTQIIPSITNLVFTADSGSTMGTVTNGMADFINTSFTDHRIEMANFADNRVYVSTDDNSIEIKFTKALNCVFVHLTTPSSQIHQIVDMTAKKPDGTDIPFTNFVDGTRGFSQSGYLYWEPEKDKYDNFQMGQQYTYTFRTDSAINATFGGINLVFCDKFDLLREYPDLDGLLGITDERIITPQLIRIMESAMLEIEKKVQNSPFWKEDRQYFFTAKELDRWDLLQINEVNQAAVYWTLAKILYFLSDTPGDVYSLKAADYRAQGETAFESVSLSLDFNDNGSLDVFEGEREAANVEITFER